MNTQEPLKQFRIVLEVGRSDKPDGQLTMDVAAHGAMYDGAGNLFFYRESKGVVTPKNPSGMVVQATHTFKTWIMFTELSKINS